MRPVPSSSSEYASAGTTLVRNPFQFILMPVTSGSSVGGNSSLPSSASKQAYQISVTVHPMPSVPFLQLTGAASRDVSLGRWDYEAEIKAFLYLDGTSIGNISTNVLDGSGPKVSGSSNAGVFQGHNEHKLI